MFLVFSSCEKDIVVLENNYSDSTSFNSLNQRLSEDSIRLETRWLKFRDTSSFISTMKKIEAFNEAQLLNISNLYGYQSYISSLEINSSNSLTEETNFFHNTSLGYIVNAQAVLQIGDWIYKFKPESNSILALPKQNISFLSSLELGRLEANYMFELSLNTDILDVLTPYVLPNDQGPVVLDPSWLTDGPRGQLFCADNFAKADSKNTLELGHPTPYYFPSSSDHQLIEHRIKGKMYYRSLGILFILGFSVDHQRQSSIGFWYPESADISVWCNFAYQQRCKVLEHDNPDIFIFENKSSVNKHVYSSTKALTYYFMETEYVVHSKDDTMDYRTTLLYADNNHLYGN